MHHVRIGMLLVFDKYVLYNFAVDWYTYVLCGSSIKWVVAVLSWAIIHVFWAKRWRFGRVVILDRSNGIKGLIH